MSAILMTIQIPGQVVMLIGLAFWNRSIFEKKLRIETAFAWSLFFVSKSPIKINHKYHI